MITAIALGTMLSVSASTSADAQTITVNSAPTKAPVVTQVADEELGFIDIWFPFMPDPLLDQTPLEPEVQENFWLLAIVSGFGPFGTFWAPMVFLDGVELHEDFTIEALIGWAIHVPFYYFFGLGIYLNIIHGINTIDRNIKKARGKPPAKWSQNNIDALPGMEKAVATAAY